MAEEIENIDSTNDDILTDEDDKTNDSEETTETEDAPEESPVKEESDLEQKNKQLYSRATKAESEVKRLKKEVEAKPGATEQISREEVVLIAQGMDDEDLEVLKTIQKGSDISLKKAKDSPLFKSYIKDKESKAKKGKSQLGASRKSYGIGKDGKPLSREEHQDEFKELTKDL